MGTVLVREAHSGQTRGVRSAQPLHPLLSAPLCTGGTLRALWGRQRAGPQGRPGWGLWNPRSPAQLGGGGCSACPGEPKLGSPACNRCQGPARSPERGLKPASRGRRRGRAGSGGERSAAQQRQKLGSALKVAAKICQGAALLSLPQPRVAGSTARDQNPRSPRVQVGMPRGGGAGCRGLVVGLLGSVLPTPTSLCRRDGLCVGVGGWTVCLGRTCLQCGTTEG